MVNKVGAVSTHFHHFLILLSTVMRRRCLEGAVVHAGRRLIIGVVGGETRRQAQPPGLAIDYFGLRARLF